MAPVHHGHAVAQALGLLHVVRRQHHGGAVALDLADDVPERPPGARVEAGGRFVEEGHDGVVDERQGDRQPLRLPTGQLVDESFGLVGQADPLEQRLAGLAAAEDAVAGAEDVDDLAQPLVVEQGGGLELHADAPFDVLGVGPDRQPVDRDLATVGPAQAFDHLEGRRFAGAVGPQDAEDLAAFHGQGDAVDGNEVAVALGQAVDADDRPSRRLCTGANRQPSPCREWDGATAAPAAVPTAARRRGTVGELRDGRAMTAPWTASPKV